MTLKGQLRRRNILLCFIIPLTISLGCGGSQDKPESPKSVGTSSSIAHGPESSPPAVQSSSAFLAAPVEMAFAYGGFRGTSRNEVPSVEQIKEDLRILSAMNVRLLRTYNTQQYAHSSNLLQAIDELKKEDPTFKMQVMLGVWIDCEGAWTDAPNHSAGDEKNNTAEIEEAVRLANQYPDIVRIIAVGNEAMVHWAATYYVSADVILKWVVHLQELKKNDKLPSQILITSSDNFASWGGDSPDYHTEGLSKLIQAVDYISLHTYPFHDTHYNSDFWHLAEVDSDLSAVDRVQQAVANAVKRAQQQYQQTKDYVQSLGIKKPIHIGETGWASADSSLYGVAGSGAADELKSKLYYDGIRDWTLQSGITCFYFEAFDEQWKDTNNSDGSENHFGLFDLSGRAKYALWNHVNDGTFKGLARDGKPIEKTHSGSEESVFKSVLKIPEGTGGSGMRLTETHSERKVGQLVTEPIYSVT